MRHALSTFALATLLAAGPATGRAAGTSHELTGEITQLDTMAGTVVVKEIGKPDHQETFSLASDAKILDGAKSKKLADLKAGDRVKVEYTDEGTSHQAHRIQRIPAPSRKGHSRY